MFVTSVELNVKLIGSCTILHIFETCLYVPNACIVSAENTGLPTVPSLVLNVNDVLCPEGPPVKFWVSVSVGVPVKKAVSSVTDTFAFKKNPCSYEFT
jgi:hypothetical protein